MTEWQESGRDVAFNEFKQASMAGSVIAQLSRTA
jgi:hypothetical protein